MAVSDRGLVNVQVVHGISAALLKSFGGDSPPTEQCCLVAAATRMVRAGVMLSRSRCRIASRTPVLLMC